MNDLKMYLNDRKAHLLRLIEEKKNALSDSPEGFLRVSGTLSNKQYYRMLQKGDTGGRYIKKKDRELVCRLAQKSYDQEVMETAREELDAIDAACSLLPKICAEDLYSTMSEVRKELVIPVYQTDDQYIREWLDSPCERKPVSDDLPDYYTDLGERVRSKSELIIANKLHFLGIPYKYECPLLLKNGIVLHPDFTVLNVRKRKELYLEHLGMMDDPDYCKNALERIQLYQRSGIYPGENLILTHETNRHPLNSRELERVLTHYLL